MSHTTGPTPPPLPNTPNYVGINTLHKGKVRPSAWWYMIIPLILLTGVGFAINTGIREGGSIIDSFSKTGPDGTTTIQLDAGEKATIFALQAGGLSNTSNLRPAHKVTIRGPHGDVVSFHESSSSTTTFDTGNKSGIDLGTFTANQSGKYHVTVKFNDPISRAAVGRLDFGAVFQRVVQPIMMSLLVSVAVLILLIIMRGASKRRLRSSPQLQSEPVTSTATQSQATTNRGPFV